MAKEDDQSWLDEAFDERKTAEDIEQAKRSRRIGYILIVVFILFIAIFGFSCVGMMDAISILS